LTLLLACITSPSSIRIGNAIAYLEQLVFAFTFNTFRKLQQVTILSFLSENTSATHKSSHSLPLPNSLTFLKHPLHVSPSMEMEGKHNSPFCCITDSPSQKTTEKKTPFPLATAYWTEGPLQCKALHPHSLSSHERRKDGSIVEHKTCIKRTHGSACALCKATLLQLHGLTMPQNCSKRAQPFT
jgi:hypothetical protein